MGFSGRYQYADGTWSAIEGNGPAPEAREPWLRISIYDSDITSVGYAPPLGGTGVAYLGVTPRIYFEDDNASAPTSADREAAGLASWWSAVHGVEDGPRIDEVRERIRGFLAEDVEEDWDPDAPDGADELDDGEIFVEVKTWRFLEVLGVPIPAETVAAFE